MSESTSFILYGRSIDINSTCDQYNSIRKQFAQEAANAANALITAYNACESREAFLERGNDEARRLLFDVIDRLVIQGTMEKNGISHTDAEGFLREYCPGNRYWPDAFRRFEEQCAAGNPTPFNPEAAKRTLHQGLYGAVFTTHWGYWRLLRKNRLAGEEPVECLAPGAAQKGQAAINDFLSLPREAALDLLPDLVRTAPYSDALYMALLSRFGDEGGERSRVAEYFGLRNLRLIKERFVEDVFRRLKPRFDAPEQTARDARAEFLRAVENCGHPEAVRRKLTEIDAILASHAPRTQAAEAAFNAPDEDDDFARSELEQIQTMLNGFDWENFEEDAATALKWLESVTPHSQAAARFVAQHIEKLRGLTKTFDEQARSVLCGGRPVLFSNRKEAALVRMMPEVQGAELAYKKYLTNPAELTPLIALLERSSMPRPIRDAYMELLSGMKSDAMPRDLSSQPAGNSRRVHVWAALCALVILLFAFTWGWWGWFGLRLVAMIFFFAGIPFGFLKSCDVDLNARLDFHQQQSKAAWRCTGLTWCAALLVFTARHILLGGGIFSMILFAALISLTAWVFKPSLFSREK